MSAGLLDSLADHMVRTSGVAPADGALAAADGKLHTTKGHAEPTVQDTVARLRISYPFLRACKVDPVLRTMVLLNLLDLNFREGEGVVVP
jgi:hypothetical protein